MGYEGHLLLLWDGYKVIRSKNVIFDESRYFAPNLPEDGLSVSGITSDQGRAKVLGIQDSSTETLNVQDKDRFKEVTVTPHLEGPPSSPELGSSSYPSPVPSDDLPVHESRPKRTTRVPA